MADFHETKMGHEFYLKNFPKLVKDVGRIADALENNEIADTLKNKAISPKLSENTIYCQRINEEVFAKTLAVVSDNDVTVGYFYKSLPSFRSKVLNRELTFQEAAYYLRDIVKQQLGGEVASIEQVSARNGFVYIAFVASGAEKGK